MIKNDILDFIQKFKFSYQTELEYIFTTGNCYYFALILQNRFNGDIYYLLNANHFVCKINNDFYDITGKVGFNEKPYKWLELSSLDKKLYDKIYRDCVTFESRK